MPQKTLGFIGGGAMASTLGRLAVDAGYEVVLSNSRGPETLADLVAELGPRARAATPSEAAAAADIVLVAIPLGAIDQLPAEDLEGKVVIDLTNYYPERDGQIAELDQDTATSSELVQRQIPGAQVVKLFNTMFFAHFPRLARPTGASDRSALPLAGDVPEAKAAATSLADELGFDVVDIGGLADTRIVAPDQPAYVIPYIADAASFSPEDPGKPVGAEDLRSLLKM